MLTVEHPEIDDIDRTIIRSLLLDGRCSVRRLAEIVSLSTSATSERLRRLEASGAILGYTARVAPEVVDRPVDAVVGVRARPGTDRESLESWIADQDSIAEAVHLTGPHDYLLRLRCRTTVELDRVLMAMKSDAGVADTETRVVLRSLPVSPAIV
jgi:Lrp/AsnC family transcriptional regulator, leucine-responsive regulatory protein